MRWLGVVVAWLYRVYSATLVLTIHFRNGSVVPGRDYSFSSEIFALLERDLLAVGGMLRYARFTALVAPGRDGDLATAIASGLGCRIVRGSSDHRGATALRHLVHHLEEVDGPAAIAVDGPLGPAGIAKGGAVACAMVTGRQVRAVAAAARWKLTFPATWSGLYLPLPFSRVVIALDDPMPLPTPPSVHAVEQLTSDLSSRLEYLTDSARNGVTSA